MDGVNLFKLASQQAKWVTARQRVIAENIANVNTNGFAPSDVTPFKEVLKGQSTGMTVTNAAHISGGVGQGEFKLNERELNQMAGSEQKVSLEKELLAAGEVRKAYELNTAIVKSFHRMILMTTRSG